MFKNYLTVALIHLVKNKLYSSINIVGLAVGLAVCILIMLFVKDELSYDTFWQNAERIYRLQVMYPSPDRYPVVTTRAPGPAKAALKNYFPEDIAHSVRMFDLSPIVKRDNNVFSESIHWVDPEFINIFTLDVIAGDIKVTLTDSTSLAINESFARKYFGKENPIGKTVNISALTLDRDYRIGAVFKDLPHNTTLAFQALAMLDENDFNEQSSYFENWGVVKGHTFFTLKEDASIATINAQLNDLVDKNIPLPGDTKASNMMVFSTLALKDIQLKSTGLWAMKPTGSMSTVIILITIAGLILLIACINFINLSTARSLQRAREVALRKTMGARRHQLILQFMGESIITTLAALLLGLVLMETTLPIYSSFLDRSLAFHYSDGLTLAILFGLVFFVGILGGIYPAIVLSGFRPAQTLKSNKTTDTESATLLRAALVTLQFSVSIFLLITTAIVYGQMVYATNMNPGFNKENMLIIRSVNHSGIVEKQDTLKEQMTKIGGVINVAYSSNAPSSTDESSISASVPSKPNIGDIQLGIQSIDYDFLNTYDIPLLAGRNYRKDFATDVAPSIPEKHDGSILRGAVIINKNAVATFGYNSPETIIGHAVRVAIGQMSDGPIFADLTVIGVIPDLHFRSLRQEINSEMYALSSPWSDYNVLTVRFKGDALMLTQQLEQLWKELFPNAPFAYSFVDEAMATEFAKEQTLAAILGLFSLLAIMIACLGLYGLASFTAERRIKEIGIRKVLGASTMDITRLLLWQFSRPALVASLIAAPIAALTIIYWVETFPYRLDTWLLIPVCLIASFITLAIAWATVAANTINVAQRNPIKALQYE